MQKEWVSEEETEVLLRKQGQSSPRMNASPNNKTTILILFDFE